MNAYEPRPLRLEGDGVPHSQTIAVDEETLDASATIEDVATQAASSGLCNRSHFTVRGIRIRGRGARGEFLEKQIAAYFPAIKVLQPATTKVRKIEKLCGTQLRELNIQLKPLAKK